MKARLQNTINPSKGSAHALVFTSGKLEGMSFSCSLGSESCIVCVCLLLKVVKDSGKEGSGENYNAAFLLFASRT